MYTVDNLTEQQRDQLIVQVPIGGPADAPTWTVNEGGATGKLDWPDHQQGSVEQIMGQAGWETAGTETLDAAQRTHAATTVRDRAEEVRVQIVPARTGEIFVYEQRISEARRYKQDKNGEFPFLAPLVGTWIGVDMDAVVETVTSTYAADANALAEVEAAAINALVEVINAPSAAVAQEVADNFKPNKPRPKPRVL